jgi:hypothetical protein
MVLLLVALPLVAWLGRALARAVTRDRTLGLVLPAPLALTLWLSAVHAASSALGSLGVGLPVATIGLAVAGAALALRERSMRRRRSASGSTTRSGSPGTCRSRPRSRAASTRRVTSRCPTCRSATTTASIC